MVERLVRERGSVGRRIWRRRKRRMPGSATDPPGPATGATTEAGAHDHRDADDDGGMDFPEGSEGSEAFDEIDVDDPPPPRPPPPAPKKGFFQKLAGAFKKDKQPPQPEPAWLVADPTRDVLAVPRGAARLDAFERAIKTTPTGTPQYRALALAFHKELQALAEGAGVDLSLLDNRVEACAQALIAAGEEERAGTLFLRVGRRHQAAELFVAAGAIDALEEAHAQIHWDEGGARQEARLAFERFEALFVVGMREAALLSLEKAFRLWHDNPVYAEIYQTFTERLGPRGRLSLSSGKNTLTVVSAWPVIIGRGEDAAVRLPSPLISRAHLQLELVDGAAVVVDLESRGGTKIGQVPLVGRQLLPAGAPIDMAGVVVETRTDGGALWLSPALLPDQRTLAVLGTSVLLPPPRAGAPGDGVTIHFDSKGRAVLDPAALLNGEPLRRPSLLLQGDKVASPAGTWSWTVL